MKTVPGLRLERLVARLAACPPEFLAPPRVGAEGVVAVDVVVGDLLVELGYAEDSWPMTEPFEPGTVFDPDRARHFRLVLFAAWLLRDPELPREAGTPQSVARFLGEPLRSLAAVVEPARLLDEPERREEFVRHALAALGALVEGETQEEAENRLETLNSASKQHLSAVLRAKEEAVLRRADAVREAMVRKDAEEGAAKGMRE